MANRGETLVNVGNTAGIDNGGVVTALPDGTYVIVWSDE